MGKTVKVLLTAAGVMAASALLLLAGAALVLSKAGLMPWDLLPLLTTALCCAAVFAGGLPPPSSAGRGASGTAWGAGPCSPPAWGPPPFSLARLLAPPHWGSWSPFCSAAPSGESWGSTGKSG